MSDADLLDLEYAALMHDIGQLSLAEPIPGGATVVAAPAEQRRIAELGADVIRQTGVLDGVASIVEQQAEPYRRAHDVQRRDVPLAARIIKAVNAYDDLVGDSFEIRCAAGRARAAAARDGLRVRPDGGRLPVQDRRAHGASRRLTRRAATRGAPPVTSSSPTPAATSTSPALTTCGHRGRATGTTSPSAAEPGARSGRLAHRVARRGAGRPARSRPGPRPAPTPASPRCADDHQTLSSSPSADERYAGQPRVAREEQPDQRPW